MRSPVDEPTTSGAGVFTDIVTDPSGPLTALLRLGRRVTFRNRAEIDKYEALRALVGPAVDRMHMFPLLDSTGSAHRTAGRSCGPTASGRRCGTSRGGCCRSPTSPRRPSSGPSCTSASTSSSLELQRRTLPEVPAIAGLAIAARYLPSSSALGLGGDWYEVQQVGEGLVGLVVGDVVGHGIEAIADMTEIRTTVSTLLRTDADLSQGGQPRRARCSPPAPTRWSSPPPC